MQNHQLPGQFFPYATVGPPPRGYGMPGGAAPHGALMLNPYASPYAPPQSAQHPSAAAFEAQKEAQEAKDAMLDHLIKKHEELVKEGDSGSDFARELRQQRLAKLKAQIGKAMSEPDAPPAPPAPPAQQLLLAPFAHPGGPPPILARAQPPTSAAATPPPPPRFLGPPGFLAPAQPPGAAAAPTPAARAPSPPAFSEISSQFGDDATPAFAPSEGDDDAPPLHSEGGDAAPPPRSEGDDAAPPPRSEGDDAAPPPRGDDNPRPAVRQRLDLSVGATAPAAPRGEPPEWAEKVRELCKIVEAVKKSPKMLKLKSHLLQRKWQCGLSVKTYFDAAVPSDWPAFFDVADYHGDRYHHPDVARSHKAVLLYLQRASELAANGVFVRLERDRRLELAQEAATGRAYAVTVRVALRSLRRCFDGAIASQVSEFLCAEPKDDDDSDFEDEDEAPVRVPGVFLAGDLAKLDGGTIVKVLSSTRSASEVEYVSMWAGFKKNVPTKDLSPVDMSSRTTRGRGAAPEFETSVKRLEVGSRVCVRFSTGEGFPGKVDAIGDQYRVLFDDGDDRQLSRVYLESNLLPSPEGGRKSQGGDTPSTPAAASKKRGRKAAAASPEEPTQDAVATKKRGRGRPRKAPLEEPSPAPELSSLRLGSRVAISRFVPGVANESLNGMRGVVVKDRGLVKSSNGRVCHRLDVKLEDGSVERLISTYNLDVVDESSPNVVAPKPPSSQLAVGSRVRICNFRPATANFALNGQRGVVVEDHGVVAVNYIKCHRFDVQLDGSGALSRKISKWNLKLIDDDDDDDAATCDFEAPPEAEPVDDEPAESEAFVTAVSDLRVGDRVCVNFDGAVTPGSVQQVHDGGFDVIFDDGDPIPIFLTAAQLEQNLMTSRDERPPRETEASPFGEGDRVLVSKFVPASENYCLNGRLGTISEDLGRVAAPKRKSGSRSGHRARRYAVHMDSGELVPGIAVYNLTRTDEPAPEIEPEPLNPALAVGKRVKLCRFPSANAALNGERGVVVEDRGLVEERGTSCHRLDVKLDDGMLCAKLAAYYLKPVDGDGDAPPPKRARQQPPASPLAADVAGAAGWSDFPELPASPGGPLPGLVASWW